MSDKVVEILDYGSEGYLVDFKQEEYQLGKYPKKHEFLKDISAMANHPKDEDKYIIIGAVEKNGIADSFMDIPDLTDQAKYQQYLNSNIEPQINFEYRPFKYKDYQLAYFRIFDNNERPYLFKEKVQIVGEEDNSKIVYREGDGLIRSGSEIKKMIRSDFERIYKNKLQQKDRKSDLKITPVLADFEDFPSDEEITVKTLDLNIENISNKSIDFDIELKVNRVEGYAISTKTEFEELMNKQTSGYPFRVNAILQNFHIEKEEKEEYFVFRRTKLRNMKTAVSIAQKEPEIEIFGKEILIIVTKPSKFGIEVTIRSDDFTKGALIRNFVLK